MNYFYFIKRLILLLIIIFFCGQGIAQTTDQNYPVTAQAFVVGQSGKKLSAYFSNTQALTVSLLLKDLTKTNVDVYLRWSIDGPGVRIASVDGYIPPTFINLQRGMLQRFSGLDLQSTYFRQELIEAQGLAGPVMRSSLPEGFYTFRVQALEAGTGREVSNMGETYFSITSPLPPVINIPSNGVTLASTGSATGGSATGSLSLSKGVVQVQWMPRHYKLPGNITSYDLKVCKIPDGYQPQEAMDACVNPIIDDRGNPGTFYPSNTGIGNSIIGEWEQGARYAVRVTIHEFDQNGDEVVFANQGRSEVTWFRYGEPCRSPESFTIKETGPGRVVLNWAAQAGADSYRILWRTSASINSATGASINSATGSLSVSKGASSVTKWNEQTVSSASGTVQGLTVGHYEFKVQNAACPDVPENAETFEIGKEDDEDKLPPALTNPMQIIVQTSGCDTASIADLASYYTNFPGVVASGVATTPDNSGKLVIPACALVSGAFSDCDAPLPVITPPATGTPLTSLKAGDVLGIYDATAFVTEATEGPDGFSGTALVRMPFLNGMLIPFAFTGLKAWASEGAAGSPARGGCVYAVTSFHSISRLSNADALAMKSKLLTALAGRQDPAAYVGTLADALKSYENLPTGSNGCPYKTAILQASDTFKDALDDLDTDNPVITSILNDLKNITDSLQAGNTVNDITQKYETIFARLDSLKKADLNNNPATLAISNVQVNELTGQSARISWEITGSGTRTPSRYVIEYTDPNGATLQETVTSTQVNLQRLLTGNRYTYRILAYDGDKVVATYGEDAFNTIKKIVPVPENLAYTTMGSDSVRITWDANREHQTYKLVYKDEDGTPHTLYPTTNSALLTGLDPNKYYDYEIVAYNNERLASDPASARVTAGEECKLGVTVSNARTNPSLTGNQTVMLVTGCLPQTFVPNAEYPKLSWSNGTTGRIQGNGVIAFTDGETAEISTESTAFIGANRLLKVNPSTSKSYTVTCRMNATSKPCTFTVDVTARPQKCGSQFSISSSAKTFDVGQPITLQSTGCDGQLQWSHGLGSKQQLKIYPSTDITVYATCTLDEGTCYSNTETIKANICDLQIYVNSKHVDTGWFNWVNSRDMQVNASGCKNGTITWEVSGKVKQKNVKRDGNRLLINKIDGDVTVTAKCALAATEVCKEVSLTSQIPFVDCNDISIRWKTAGKQGYIEVYEENDPFVLTDAKGTTYSSTIDPTDKKSKALVPVSAGSQIYHVSFPEKSCTIDIEIDPYKMEIYTKPLSADLIQITEQTADPLILRINENFGQSNPLRCDGKLIWTNDQDQSSIVYDLSTNQTSDKTISFSNIQESTRTIPFPEIATTYYATCHLKTGDGGIIVIPATNSKKLLPVSNKCFTIKSTSKRISKGERLELNAVGCIEAAWYQDSKYLGKGKNIIVTPAPEVIPATEIYTANCTDLNCAEEVSVNVLPCNFQITAPQKPVRIAEPSVLTTSGCTGGQIQWSTGETGPSVTVKPFDDTKYTAWCTLNGVTLCADELTVKVDKAAPQKIECPDFSLTYQPALKCSPVVVTPKGCPASGTILWENTTKTSGETPYTFDLKEVRHMLKATCTSYNQSVTAEIEIVQLPPDIKINPGKVYAGVPVILRASGCFNQECKEGTYYWTNLTSLEAYRGPFITATFVENTNFSISCGDGMARIITINVEKPNCNPGITLAPRENSNQVELNAHWCDTKFPITWTLQHQEYNPAGKPITTTKEYTAAKNRRKHTVKRPDDITYSIPGIPGSQIASYPDSYTVNCVNEKEGVPCQMQYLVYTPKLYANLDSKPTLNTAGSTDPPGTPDFCSGLKFIETAGNGPKGTGYLYSDFCPGHVQWFARDDRNTGSMIADLSGGARYQTSIINETDIYYYTCYYNGNKCLGEAQIEPDPAYAGGRIGSIEAGTSNIIEKSCPNTTPLTTAMEAYYKTLLCQTTNLYKGDRAAAQAFVEDMIASIKAKSPGTNIQFPANLNAVIDAMVAGDCNTAAQLLAAANGSAATINNSDYNNNLVDNYDQVMDHLIPEEGEQCDAPPAPIPDNNIVENNSGRISAIDFNTPFIAPDGRPVKLPTGATPMFFIFSGTRGTPPSGTLQGFYYNNKTYFAEVFTGNRKFLGYRPTTDLCSESNYLDVYDHALGTTAYYFEYFNENSKCGYYLKKGAYQFKPAGDELLIESLPKMTGELAITFEFKNCDAGKKFYKDFGLASGKYYDALYPQTLLKEIDDLVESLMDQGLYDEFLKSGAAKLAAQNLGGKITENDLRTLLAKLKAYQQALTEVYGAPSPTLFRRMLTFFQKYFEIQTTTPPPSIDCQIGDAIVPREWWDRDSPLNYLPITLPMAAGFVDGAYEMAHGILQLPALGKSISQLAACWFSPVYMIWGDSDCAATRSATISSLVFIKDMMDSDSEASQKVSAFRNSLGASLNLWADQTFCFGSTQAQARCCDYHQGKLVLDIASLFYGPGEIKAGLKGFKLSTFVGQKLTVELTSLLNKIKLPPSMLLKPVKDVGFAMVLSGMVSLSDNALSIVKGTGTDVSMVLARTSGIATTEAIASAEALVAEGLTKALAEATGTIEKMPLKIVDQAGNGLLKDSQKIIFSQKNASQDIILSQINEQTNSLAPFAILSLAGTLTRIPDKETPGCEVCKTRSKAVCDAFVKTRTTAIAGGMAKVTAETALDKICAAIASEANLLAIAAKLNGTDFTATTVSAFLGDVNQSLGVQALDGNLGALSVSILDSWTTVREALNRDNVFDNDFKLLTSIVNINADGSKKAAFNLNGKTLKDFIALYNDTRCNTCGNQGYKYMPLLNEILENTAAVYVKHHSIPNFSGWYSREVWASDREYTLQDEAGNCTLVKIKIGRDGAQHHVKYMAEHNFTDNTIGIDQCFGGTALYPNRQFDIYLSDASPIRFVEFKSYSSGSDLGTEAVEQLLSYFSRPEVNDLTDILYVFNGSKLTLNEAKQKMKGVFKANNYAIWERINSFPCIQNITGFNGLVGRDDFIDMVEQLDDRIFKFVTIN